MREDEFRSWLQTLASRGKTPIGAAPIRDAVSRCKRVKDGMNVDLDDEFRKDRGKSLIDLLTYTSEDQRQKRPAPDGLSFKPGANLKDGLASLRSAVKKYFEFCQDCVL